MNYLGMVFLEENATKAMPYLTAQKFRKPIDKAAVENSVKIVSQCILGKQRNQHFNTFYELQVAVA